MQYTVIFKVVKNENFQWKFVDIFLIFAQNIDCGYTLEPPPRGGSNEYPQSMFWSKNKNQRTIGPENAHLKPDLGVLSHHEMLTLNTHTPLLTSQGVCICKVSGLRLHPVISEKTIISILIFK